MQWHMRLLSLQSLSLVLVKGEAYDKLLENDYIESQLGSRFCITDHINTEIDEWIQTFMLRWELEEIQLKYGN